MRTKPIIGRTAWFGPRRLGWGLSPVSPEGWAVVVVAVAAIAGVASLTRSRWAAVLVVIPLLIVGYLKGTSPGGPRQWEEFQAQKDAGHEP
jgi:hypothetical protein